MKTIPTRHIRYLSRPPDLNSNQDNREAPMWPPDGYCTISFPMMEAALSGTLASILLTAFAVLVWVLVFSGGGA